MVVYKWHWVLQWWPGVVFAAFGIVKAYAYAFEVAGADVEREHGAQQADEEAERSAERSGHDPEACIGRSASGSLRLFSSSFAEQPPL